MRITLSWMNQQEENPSLLLWPSHQYQISDRTVCFLLFSNIILLHSNTLLTCFVFLLTSNCCWLVCVV